MIVLLYMVMVRMSIDLSDETIDRLNKAKIFFNEKTFSKALNKYVKHSKLEVKL